MSGAKPPLPIHAVVAWIDTTLLFFSLSFCVFPFVFPVVLIVRFSTTVYFQASSLRVQSIVTDLLQLLLTY